VAISNARNGYINGTTSGWVARSLFPVGNDWYAVVLNTSAVLIEVHKSTDGGVTFTEQDSSNSLGHSGATHSYDAWLDGTNLHILYRPTGATNTLRVRIFDTTTDTHAGSDVGGADASTTANSDFGVGVTVRSDGDVLVFFRDGTNDVAYRRYEGSSWAAAAQLNTTQTSIPLSITMTGNSDMAHALYFEQVNNDISNRSIDSSNTLGTHGDLDATALAGPIYSSFMGYVNDGGTHRIAALSNDSTGEFDFLHSTSSSAPTWTTVANASPTSTSDPGRMGGVVVPWNGKWVNVWSGDGRGTVHHDISDDYASPTFGLDTDIVTGLANDPAVYAAASATGVGVLYTDHTTPSVDFVYAQGMHDDGTKVFVERVQSFQTTSANTVSSFSSVAATTTGHLLVAFISGKTSSQTISTLADSAGNTWAKITDGLVAATNSQLEVWYCLNATSITTMTVTFTGTVLAAALDLYEITGHDTSSPINASSTAGSNDSGSNTTFDCGSPQAAAGPALLLGGITSSSQSALTAMRASALWTEQWQTGSGTLQFHATAYRRVADASAYALTFTSSASSTNSWAWVAIAEASSGATGTVSADTVPIAGGSVTGTAGQGATGTVSADTIPITGGSVTGTFPTDDTGTVTADTIPLAYGSITGTAGTGDTATVSVDNVPLAYGNVSATAGTGDTGTVTGSTVVISGGSVTGTGDTSEDATGTVSADTIPIAGGSVTGTAGALGDVTGFSVVITGGSVSATAGTSATGTVSVGTVSIVGGTVNATAGEAADAIVTGSTVVIAGGNVTATDTNQSFGELQAFVNLRPTLAGSVNLRATVSAEVNLRPTLRGDVNLTPTIDADLNMQQTISGSLDLAHTN